MSVFVGRGGSHLWALSHSLCCRELLCALCFFHSKRSDFQCVAVAVFCSVPLCVAASRSSHSLCLCFRRLQGRWRTFLRV